MRVLVIEDDPRVARLVARALVEAGHSADVVADGRAGLERAESGEAELLVLDLMLPGLDGLEVCRRLRERGLRVPILMLTARDAVLDRVLGLRTGADDYLVKPFALEELLARVDALGRRAFGRDERPLTVGDLTLDPTSGVARRGDREVQLTARELRLLEYLMRNPRRVLTKEQITEHVWGYDSEATSNVVEIYVHYLRDKVDRGFPRPLIRTVRGIGYTIRE